VARSYKFDTDKNYFQMRILKLVSLLVAITVLMTSCFLFKKKHERCPAYGINKSDQHEVGVPLDVTVVFSDEESV